MNMDYPGNLYVVAAPSGTGKSSLVKALLEVDARMELSVSHTTRAPRGQEMHGREYYFVSNEEFDRMVAHNAFIEWAHVHSNRYGTSRKAIEERMAVDGTIELWTSLGDDAEAVAASAAPVSHEAAVGGTIGLLKEGDSITIDARQLLLQVNVSDEELAERRAAWTEPAPRYTKGVLAKFAKLVSSASLGAVTDRF